MTPFHCQTPDHSPFKPIDFNDKETAESGSSMVGVSQDASAHEIFSSTEVALYLKRKEEGYNIKTDHRYNYWLSLQSETPPGPSPTAELTYHSAVSKVIGTIHPVIINPKVNPKSSARVVTSEECRKEIMEKEEKKKEALRLKEERKAERIKKQEERQKLQEEKKKKQDEKKEARKALCMSINIKIFC